MANLPIKDGAASSAYLKATGAGSDGDPYIVEHAVSGGALGTTTETAPASDTAAAGLNGRLQRVAQRLSSLIALLPGSLGQQARAASLAVTLSTEDVTALTPPATQAISAATLPLPAGAATAANQATLIGHVDGIEAALAATIEVGGRNRVISAAVTRPADTTTYAVGDALANSTSAPVALAFAGCARANGGSGAVVGLVVVDDAAGTTALAGDLWLFAGTAAPTATNDNATFNPSDADALNVVAVIPFSVGSAGTSNRLYDVGPLNIPFQCGAGVSSLWGLVRVTNAYPPVSGETVTFKLRIVQD